jgi:hypothetical protein
MCSPWAFPLVTDAVDKVGDETGIVLNLSFTCRFLSAPLGSDEVALHDWRLTPLVVRRVAWKPPPLRHHPAMVSLSDRQLAAVMDAARTLQVERRDLFLQRVGAMLRMRGRFTDSDVVDVTQLAMAGLVQQPAA